MKKKVFGSTIRICEKVAITLSSFTDFGSPYLNNCSWVVRLGWILRVTKDAIVLREETLGVTTNWVGGYNGIAKLSEMLNRNGDIEQKLLLRRFKIGGFRI